MTSFLKILVGDALQTLTLSETHLTSVLCPLRKLHCFESMAGLLQTQAKSHPTPDEMTPGGNP